MERGGSRTGSRMGERTNSYANRGASPAAWGPGEGRETSRPAPNREPRVDRAPTAAEQDNQWRTKMRPDAPVGKSPVPSRSGSEAPASPSLAAAAPVGRPKLNLQKRTVADAPGVASPSLTDSKASPFGAARPIDTATREREIEEKHQRELQEKKEAEEKAKEERRLAKEAAVKDAADKEAAAKEAADKAATEKSSDDTTTDTNGAAESKAESATTVETATPEATNGTEQKLAIRTREPREAPPTRAAESGNWRSSGTRGAPSGPRGGRGGRGGGTSRGGRDFEERQPSRRGNMDQRRPSEQRRGSGQEAPTPTTPVVDADGFQEVKLGKKGRGPRQPVA